MQKFIFVITSILILSLIGCSDVVGQGTGSVKSKNPPNKDMYGGDNTELEWQFTPAYEQMKLQYLELDQYNKQLRSDIEQMQKDIQREQMINNSMIT